jgi:dTDP-4-amino-4,6-dideoxygalactose transaminase
MFYIKCKDLEERTSLISYLGNRDIMSVFHYVPLHSSPAGLRYGRTAADMSITDRESNRLTRLPMYYGLTDEDVDRVCDAVHGFYAQ